MFEPPPKMAADEKRKQARLQRHAQIVLRVEDYYVFHKDGIPEQELVAKVAVKEGVRMQLAQSDIDLLIAAEKLSASGAKPTRFVFPANASKVQAVPEFKEP